MAFLAKEDGQLKITSKNSDILETYCIVTHFCVKTGKVQYICKS